MVSVRNQNLLKGVGGDVCIYQCTDQHCALRLMFSALNLCCAHMR